MIERKSNKNAEDIIRQIDKMVGNFHNKEIGYLRKYINPEFKRVILYTEENLSRINTGSLNKIRDHIKNLNKELPTDKQILITGNFDDLLKTVK